MKKLKVANLNKFRKDNIVNFQRVAEGQKQLPVFCKLRKILWKTTLTESCFSRVPAAAAIFPEYFFSRCEPICRYNKMVKHIQTIRRQFAGNFYRASIAPLLYYY